LISEEKSYLSGEDISSKKDFMKLFSTIELTVSKPYKRDELTALRSFVFTSIAGYP
jgi:hypothetical protein